MKASEIIGQRGRVVVIDGEIPCACRFPNSPEIEPLTETVEGTYRNFIRMPAGPVGIIETDDGRLFAFDAVNDVRAGKISFELFANQ